MVKLCGGYILYSILGYLCIVILNFRIKAWKFDLCIPTSLADRVMSEFARLSGDSLPLFELFSAGGPQLCCGIVWCSSQLS